MSLPQQQELHPEMWPAVLPEVPNTIPGESGHLNEPQNTSGVDVQVALQHVLARKEMITLFQQNRAQLNKYGVTVTSDPASTEETINLTLYENEKIVPVTVKNSGVTTVYLTLWASALVKNIFTLRDCQGNIIKSIKQHPVGPGEEFKINVHFFSQYAGYFEQLLVFKFETCQQSSDKFEIMRLLEVTHWTSSREELFPTNPCNRQTQECISIERPKYGKVLTRPVVPLKSYAIPDNIKDITNSNSVLQTPLQWSNYPQRLHLLLHLEELNLKRAIAMYDEDDVPIFRLKYSKDLFYLQMSGDLRDLEKLSRTLARVNPVDRSVVGNTIYIGWVQHVAAEKVFVEFDEMFQSHFKEGMRFSVDFALDRIPLRVQHRAVASVNRRNLEEVLFPTGKHSSHNQNLPGLLGFENNPEQRKAIQHIVAGTAKPAPYLVFGPPGTGKTVTLVGAISQILETQKSCHILACAPSNSAIDHLCEKIVESNKNKHLLYRMYAVSYHVKKVPQDRKFHCNLMGEKGFRFPTKRQLMKYKVIFTTLLTAGRLVAAGIPVWHFSYIFVDEAGQTTETECLIPLSGLLTPGECQVVLAGDPKQLGPVITSRMAKDNGLGVSMLERLMTDIDLYKSDDTHGFNNHFITKLLRNYRSHPAILEIPNELFYKGELQAFAHEEKCMSYCKWEQLPKKGFPLIFHGVAGNEEREDNCPSVYNLAELEVLKEYLKAVLAHLHKNGVTKIGPKEIGIITPYRKQVEKIRNAFWMDKDLKKENLENIMVGSVEQFQGQECNVIILSTVRSFPKLTTRKGWTLGFVDNEKRFNVALTRARALLIVVGDPRVLKAARIWNKFIHYCYKEGGYRGISVYDAEEEEDTDSCTLKEPLSRVIQQQMDPC